MSRRQTLESWLVEAMTDEDKEDPITAIALMHVVGEHSSDREIHSVRFGAKVWKESDLAELFRRKAESYCQEMPGSQLFVLLAYYGKVKEPQARHPFRVNPTSEIGGLGALTTEAPNETGVRQQSMRLTEALVQGAFRERALLMDNVLRSNELLARHNQRLLEEQQGITEAMRAMLLQQVTSQHELRMQEMAQLQKKELVDKGMELLPAIINSLAGKEVVPKSTEDASILSALASALKPEQVQLLAASIPPEVMGPLANRLAELLREKEKKEKEGKRRLQLLSAEDDAVGGKNG